MGSPQHPTSMKNLPGEVLSEIFVRLLAKQIGQMRCVSKSWNALLSDSSFVKSHLNHSIQNNNEILLFFDIIFSFNSDLSPFTARPCCSPDLELANFIKPPVIPECKFGCVDLIRSVNGLICFFYKLYNDGCVVHIWNPSLTAMLTLPPRSSPSTEYPFVFGFGYDPKSDDYKVVKLTTVSGLTQPEVYSVRKGSWKPISQSFPSHIKILRRRNNQICVDNSLHWLGLKHLGPKRKTIVGFDLGEEAFIEIPLPASILDFNVYKPFTILGALGGKLCVMSRAVSDGGKWEVWVMDEYGVAKSWVKHLVFSQFGGDIIPYGFTSHSEFLFQVRANDDRFGLYDPVAAKTKSFEIISRRFFIMNSVEYVESLVWVAPPKHDISSCDISQLQNA